MVRIMGWSLVGVLVAAGAVAGPMLLGDGDGVRPPAVFDHGAHVQALGADRCAACHERSSAGDLRFAEQERNRDLAHAVCGDCHLDQQQGPHPALCGACHVARGVQRFEPAAAGMESFDHDQHLEALDGACQRCHHVMDEATGLLVAADGDEAACSDCHDGPQLRQAAHQQCVACHAGRPGEVATGPVSCAACHGSVAPD